MSHARYMAPGQEWVARAGAQERLVLWRTRTGDRYHLYLQDVARGLDRLIGVYGSPAAALADVQTLAIR